MSDEGQCATSWCVAFCYIVFGPAGQVSYLLLRGQNDTPERKLDRDQLPLASSPRFGPLLAPPSRKSSTSRRHGLERRGSRGHPAGEHLAIRNLVIRIGRSSEDSEAWIWSEANYVDNMERAVITLHLLLAEHAILTLDKYYVLASCELPESEHHTLCAPSSL